MSKNYMIFYEKTIKTLITMKTQKSEIEVSESGVSITVFDRDPIQMVFLSEKELEEILEAIRLGKRNYETLKTQGEL